MLRVESYLVDNDLKVGAYIPVKLTLQKEENIIIVPFSAICKTDGQKPYVFMVKDKKLKSIPVKLGIVGDKFVEVKNIKESTLVVKDPFLSWVKLADGESVKIIKKD